MEEEKNDKKEECGKGRCGGRCCCAKALVAVILLLLGGVVGFLIGHCGGRGMCGMDGKQMMGRMCPMPTGQDMPGEMQKGK